MKILPLGKRILIRSSNSEARTSSGIYIPTKKEENMGEVVSIGSEVTLVKEGDKVIYSNFAGNKVTSQAEELVIVEEKEVIAKIEL